MVPDSETCSFGSSQPVRIRIPACLLWPRRFHSATTAIDHVIKCRTLMAEQCIFHPPLRPNAHTHTHSLRVITVNPMFTVHKTRLKSSLWCHKRETGIFITTLSHLISVQKGRMAASPSGRRRVFTQADCVRGAKGAETCIAHVWMEY